MNQLLGGHVRTKQRPETPVTENKSPAKCGSLPSNQGTERVQGNVVRDAVEAHTCTAHVRHRSTECAQKVHMCIQRNTCTYRKCACAYSYITIQHVHCTYSVQCTCTSISPSNKIHNHTKKQCTHTCVSAYI